MSRRADGTNDGWAPYVSVYLLWVGGVGSGQDWWAAAWRLGRFFVEGRGRLGRCYAGFPLPPSLPLEEAGQCQRPAPAFWSFVPLRQDLFCVWVITVLTVGDIGGLSPLPWLSDSTPDPVRGRGGGLGDFGPNLRQLQRARRFGPAGSVAACIIRAGDVLVFGTLLLYITSASVHPP